MCLYAQHIEKVYGIEVSYVSLNLKEGFEDEVETNIHVLLRYLSIHSLQK